MATFPLKTALATSLVFFWGFFFAGNWVFQDKDTPPQIQVKKKPVPENKTLGFFFPDGDAVPHEYFAGKWTLLSFGEIGCGKPCRRHLQLFRRGMGIIAKKKAPIQYTFVLANPSSRKGKTLQKVLSRYNKNLKGLVVPEEKMAKVAQFFRSTPAHLQEEATSTNSQRKFFLINPKIEIQAVFSLPADSSKLASKAAAISKTNL